MAKTSVWDKKKNVTPFRVTCLPVQGEKKMANQLILSSLNSHSHINLQQWAMTISIWGHKYVGASALLWLTSGMKPISLRWLLSSGSWKAIIWEKTVRYSETQVKAGQQRSPNLVVCEVDWKQNLHKGVFATTTVDNASPSLGTFLCSLLVWGKEFEKSSPEEKKKINTIQ